MIGVVAALEHVYSFYPRENIPDSGLMLAEIVSQPHFPSVGLPIDFILAPNASTSRNAGFSNRGGTISSVTSAARQLIRALLLRSSLGELRAAVAALIGERGLTRKTGQSRPFILQPVIIVLEQAGDQLRVRGQHRHAPVIGVADLCRGRPC
jgi:hypothetical protein